MVLLLCPPRPPSARLCGCVRPAAIGGWTGRLPLWSHGCSGAGGDCGWGRRWALGPLSRGEGGRRPQPGREESRGGRRAPLCPRAHWPALSFVWGWDWAPLLDYTPYLPVEIMHQRCKTMVWDGVIERKELSS
jgi:hypothetical protein